MRCFQKVSAFNLIHPYCRAEYKWPWILHQVSIQHWRKYRIVVSFVVSQLGYNLQLQPNQECCPRGSYEITRILMVLYSLWQYIPWLSNLYKPFWWLPICFGSSTVKRGCLVLGCSLTSPHVRLYRAWTKYRIKVNKKLNKHKIRNKKNKKR